MNWRDLSILTSSQMPWLDSVGVYDINIVKGARLDVSSRVRLDIIISIMWNSLSSNWTTWFCWGIWLRYHDNLSNILALNRIPWPDTVRNQFNSTLTIKYPYFQFQEIEEHRLLTFTHLIFKYSKHKSFYIECGLCLFSLQLKLSVN